MTASKLGISLAIAICISFTLGCPAKRSDSPEASGSNSTESTTAASSVPASETPQTQPPGLPTEPELAASTSTAAESGIEGPVDDHRIKLMDRTEGSGLNYVHYSGRTGINYIVETVTCGLTTLDFDGDGRTDIYVPNGAGLDGAGIEPAPTNRLFRNVGKLQFKDVTQESGAGDIGFALGAAVGDLNNDGMPEIIVSNYGNSIVLQNCGDGTFERQEIANSKDYKRVGAGIAMLDFDRDGNLDLFVSNYVVFNFETKVARYIFGVPAAPGPRDYPADPDQLLRNLGNGQFLDISESSGIADQAGPGMGTVAFDMDGDSDTDIFVCNDSLPNFAYINQGDGTFVEDALLRGLAYGSDGASKASMGVDVGDIDHNGLLDLVSTNFSEEIPNLYSNAGGGFFDDIGAAGGLGVANRSVSWGIGLVDLDNDTWDDCVIVAGNVVEGAGILNDVDKFRAPHHVLRNERGKFTQDGVAGNATDAIKVSRGAVFDDFDNDGRVDAVVHNLNTGLQLISNETQNANHFVNIKLIGTQANRDAVGTKLKLRCGDTELFEEAIRGRGYQSHYESEIHFGLETASRIDQLTVDWPNGTTQVFKDLPINATIAIVEGSEQFRILN